MARKANPKRKTKKTQNSHWFIRLFKFCFKWGLVMALWATIIIGGILFYYAGDLKSITKEMVFERRPTIIIKASNGDIVDRYGDIKGDIIDIKDLPPHVVNAVLAIEDRRFYHHYAIDPIGIARAFVVNFQRGGFVQGGSTITQQLAKNLFLTRDRTIKRKIQEMLLAIQLENELTKDEILSAYLNRVYLGSGAYGIDAAARTYFNKPAKDLSVKESATIAGLLKAPSRYSPNANPKLSADRTKVVLKAMEEAGYLNADEYKLSSNAKPVPRRKPSSSDSVRYYTDYIIGQIEDLIGPVSGDITVETTMNVAIQNELEEAITKKLLQYKTSKNVDQAAGMVMRLDGAVMAVMGGANYDMSEFNRVTDSLRPPGSSFKPIVYLTALENGWNMNSLITDEPRNYGSYRPRNFGNKYYGEVTLTQALTLSLNTVAVALTKNVSPAEVIKTAQKLGITADLENSLSTALGSNGIPMTQMVTAYATLGRGGSAVDPYSIVSIKDKNGTILYKHEPPQETRQVVTRTKVAQLNNMMQSVVQNGTGQAANIPYPTAGKTGTSQDYRDAWFIGYTDKYAAAIWYGNDNNAPTKKLTGGSAPAQTWREVMLKAQTQGGKSYADFYGDYGINSFDSMLGGLVDDHEYDNRNFDGYSNGNWFSGVFNRDNRQQNRQGQEQPSYKPSVEQQQQYRRPEQGDEQPNYAPPQKRDSWNVNE